jgi:hypothetical protein
MLPTTPIATGNVVRSCFVSSWTLLDRSTARSRVAPPSRTNWTDELLNWITKYEMIVVVLTLVGVATHERGREYKKANVKLNTQMGRLGT